MESINAGSALLDSFLGFSGLSTVEFIRQRALKQGANVETVLPSEVTVTVSSCAPSSNGFVAMTPIDIVEIQSRRHVSASVSLRDKIEARAEKSVTICA